MKIEVRFLDTIKDMMRFDVTVTFDRPGVEFMTITVAVQMQGDEVATPAQAIVAAKELALQFSASKPE